MFVKFVRAGRHARESVQEPQFEVEVGDVVEVTESHANDLVSAGAAEITDGPEDPKEDEIDGDDTDDAEDGASNEKPSLAERLKNNSKKKSAKKKK